MGVFAEYHGTMRVPGQLKEKFADQMMKILNYGGMMELEKVSIYGQDILLLKPLRILPGETVHFHYNYFEDDSWETAGFKAEKPYFWSNKIGNSEFSDVIATAYTLFELYDPEPSYTLIEGEFFNIYPVVGWINQLSGTKFSLEKRFHLWELAEKYALTRLEDGYSEVFSFSDILDMIPCSFLYYAGGIELTDLCYITHGTDSLNEERVKPGSYPADILNCKNEIAAYLQNAGEPDALEKLWNLIHMDREQRSKVKEPQLVIIAEMTLILPARALVYLVSELQEQDFWINWKKLSTDAYHDEILKEYAPAEITEFRKKKKNVPVPTMSTSDFLRQDGWFTFYDTPEELKDQPAYYLSDDDRLYWWDGTDEVRISGEMDEWLKELAKRHKLKMEETSEEYENSDSDALLKDFLLLLVEIDDYYQRIFPFQDMFYEFIRNGNRPEYKAAVSLLRELAEENRQEGAAIRHRKNWWDLSSRKVTFNPGRLRMKRFMSIMANGKLRKKYFDF